MSDRRAAAAGLAKRQVDVGEIIDWAYRRQRVEHAGGDDAAAWLGHGVTITAHVAETLAIGAIVDCSRKLGHPVHPDALVVQRAVEEAGGPLVLAHARAGGIGPAWFPEGPGRFVAVRKADGSRAMVWPASGSKKRPVACLVELVGPEPNVVAWSRREYGRWWDGLARVADALRAEAGRLVAHVVVGPVAPRAPWLTHGRAQG